jgi:threonine aldolase
VETNIVLFDTREGVADRVSQGAAARGVLVSPVGPSRLRAVTHLGIASSDVDVAIEILGPI